MVSPLTDISTQVTGELMNDERTKDYCQHIDVAADRGIITLTGTVPNQQVSEAAEEITRNIPGVITVQNELRVKRK